jgi:hypothetical protein
MNQDEMRSRLAASQALLGTVPVEAEIEMRTALAEHPNFINYPVMRVLRYDKMCRQGAG